MDLRFLGKGVFCAFRGNAFCIMLGFVAQGRHALVEIFGAPPMAKPANVDLARALLPFYATIGLCFLRLLRFVVARATCYAKRRRREGAVEA